MGLINCGSAYTQTIGGCIERIALDLGLTGDTDYTIQFRFENGAILERTYTTDASGLITLAKNNDLAGFWNEGTGLVLFNVYATDSCEAEVITICEVEYTDLVINFQYVDTEATEAEFPCPCS